MSELWPHIAALGGSILLGPCSQILMKRGASSQGSAVRAFMSPWTLGGYGLMGVVTVLTVFAYQRLELKTVAAWTSLNYLLVVLLARFFLKEPLTPGRLVGCGMIVAGVALFSI